MTQTSTAVAATPFSMRLMAEELTRVLNNIPDHAWLVGKHSHRSMAQAILVSVGGTRNRDFPLCGPVMETALMADNPLLRRIAYALDIQLSRCCLLRVAAGGQTPPLTDDSYYWYRHAPIYIPMQWSAEATLIYRAEKLPLQVGDIWSLAAQQAHWIENHAQQAVICLVLESRTAPRLDGFVQRLKQSANLLLLSQPAYRFEVLTPAELQTLCHDIKDSLQSSSLSNQDKKQYETALNAFQQEWEQAFARFGHDRHGELAYFDCLQDFLEHVLNPAARTINQHPRARHAAHIIRSMLWTAPPPPKRLNQQRLAQFQHRQLPNMQWQGVYQSLEHLKNSHLPTPQRSLLSYFAKPTTAAAAQSQTVLKPHEFSIAVQQLLARKRLQEVIECPHFDRPVFILSAPRAGSTLLFETLSQVPDLWSVGGESHELFESIPALHPQAKNYASNRLTEADAQPKTIEQLLENFSHHLQDRNAHRYVSQSREQRPATVRFLEKTPKNALRVAFLKAVFPDALFIFLYREPRDNISSLLEGWRSRRFLAYRHLPGWAHKEWHFLLPPDWQQYHNASLAEIAAFQWRAANQYALNDLQKMSRNHWFALSYHKLIEQPQASIQAIRDFAGWHWDERIARRVATALPVSHMTLSEPCTEKWRRHEHELRDVLPGLVPLQEEIAQVLAEQS